MLSTSVQSLWILSLGRLDISAQEVRVGPVRRHISFKKINYGSDPEFWGHPEKSRATSRGRRRPG